MSNENKIIEFDFDNSSWKLEITQDPDPLSPRDGERLGTMLYHHKKYNLGDERVTFDSFDEYLLSAGLDPDEIVSLPLYLLDHSGLRMSTRDFGDPWDSGCVGVIFTTHEKIKDAFSVVEDNVSQELIDNALEILNSEVEEFDSYLSGEIYGYLLSKKEDDEFVEKSSCWGFSGDNPLDNGMLDHLDEQVASIIKKKLTRSLKP